VVLPKIGEHDLVIDPVKPEALFEAIKNIVSLIIQLCEPPPAECEKLCRYLSAASYQNDDDYRALLERLPSPIYENSLEARHPDLLREWHPVKNASLTPADVAAMSSLKVWWQCSQGHEWESTVGNRTNGRNSCPYCAHQILTFENSLAAKRPDLVAEWDLEKNGLAADKIFAFTSELYWWRCAKGHKWQARPSNRASSAAGKNTGCPYCANKKVNAENCLSITHPALIAEWHSAKNGDLRPDAVTHGTYKKVWWQCSKGHEWFALISSRSKGNGCPYCANQAVSAENSLATLYPALANEWHPIKNAQLTPISVVPGSSKKVWWQCKHGHDWEASPSQRSRVGLGLPLLFRVPSQRRKLSSETEPQSCFAMAPRKKWNSDGGGSYAEIETGHLVAMR